MPTDPPQPVPHIGLEVELRVPLYIPLSVVDQDPGEMSDHQLRELVRDDPDRLADAIQEHLEQMPEFDVSYDEDVERELPQSFRTHRPTDPDGSPALYVGPAPSLLDRVRTTDAGPLFVDEAPANVLSDEQARGALWALRQAWNLPGMQRLQKGYLIALLSELEWICCARPALHRFDASGEDATICAKCGTGEPGHDRPGSTREQATQEQPRPSAAGEEPA